MEDYPKNVMEFETRFSSEEACRDYLYQLRWPNGFLDEFTFRFNRRTSQHRGKLFYRLLQNAVQVEPVTFNQLVKNVKK